MLVLSRRVGESVVIGHDVVVTVLEVRGDVVRVGIAAPRTTQVHREEVYRELLESNQSAAATSDAAITALTARLARKPAVEPAPSPAPAPAPEANDPASTAPPVPPVAARPTPADLRSVTSPRPPGDV